MDPEFTFEQLPFGEALDFLRQKVGLPTGVWRDLMREHHDVAFAVAGVTKAQLLADFQEAVSEAIEKGETLRDFQERFDVIVQEHGWSHRGERGWRSRVILLTNVRTSYAAGRRRQMEAVVVQRPYWQYQHSDSAQPREEHLALDGLVLRHDHPFWRTAYPPNGWGCACYVVSLTPRQVEAMRQAGTLRDTPPGTVEVVDERTGEVIETYPGVTATWAYAPGATGTDRRAATLRSAVARLPASLQDQARGAVEAAGVELG